MPTENSIVINGNKFLFDPGETILEIAHRNSIDIPTLCHLKRATPTGACRMCVVEVEGARSLVASCAAPAAPNLDHFCIALDRASWDQLERRLMERGLAIDGPRQVWGARGRGTSIYVSDPDGNTVEFKTYEEPAGG